jgi:hypothetical protein
VTAAAASELLAGVCRGGGACTPCPSFTSDDLGTLSPQTVLYGRFTDPARTDALIDMDGCASHAENFGGSLLLRWQAAPSGP